MDKDIESETRALAREDKETVELLGGLLRNPGFVRFCELLNKMTDARGAEVLSPAGSVDGAMRLEHVKGTMNGLILARDLASAIVQSNRAEKDSSDDAERVEWE